MLDLAGPASAAGAPAAQSYSPAPRPAAPPAAPSGGDPGGSPINFFEGMAPGRKLAGDIINRGGAAGAFGPYFLRNMLRKRALANADAQRRRMSVTSTMYGLDPAQARVAAIEAENNANAGLAGSLNDAEMTGLQRYQDYVMQLLTGERGMAEQQRMQDKQRKAAEAAGWGSLAGGATSAAIGKWG
jgi:hypothetical protein